jgi:hypothetical protein
MIILASVDYAGCLLRTRGARRVDFAGQQRRNTIHLRKVRSG